MKKMTSKLIAVLTALCLMLTAVPALAREGAVGPDVLAVVDGVEVPVGQAQYDLEYYASQNEMYAQYYGVPFDLEALKEDIAVYYVKLYLIQREAEALGLIDYTDEELAEIDARAEAMFEETLTQYADYFRGEGMTEEQTRRAVIDWMAAQGFTLDFMKESELQEETLRRYEEHVMAGVDITDEQLQAYYDQKVAAATELYDAVPSEFENDVLSGQPIYYVPEGFRSVFHILLLLSSEEQAQLQTLQGRLSAAKEALTAEGADTDALNEEIEATEGEIEALLEPLYQRIAQITARLDAGEDFMALIPEYNEDPGMMNEPTRTNGYYVSAGSQMWVPEFRDAAMALENPGDWSEPVRTAYGLHLIYYAGEVESGPRAYETVADHVTDEVYDTVSAETMEAAIQALYDGADVTLYLENLHYGEESGDEATDSAADADDEAAEEADEAAAVG